MVRQWLAIAQRSEPLSFLQVESQESGDLWLEWHGCAMWMESLRRQSRAVGKGRWIRRATW